MSLIRRRRLMAVVKSAESPRMAGLARIPTIERRDAAVRLLLRRAR